MSVIEGMISLYRADIVLVFAHVTLKPFHHLVSIPANTLDAPYV